MKKITSNLAACLFVLTCCGNRVGYADLIDPFVFATNYQNVLRGHSRYQSTPSYSLEVSVGVYPSPDSDIVRPPDFPDLPLSGNGTATRVFASHPIVTNGEFQEIPFGGLESSRGYGWGAYAANYDRTVFDPLLDPGIANPWQVRVENADAPTVGMVETATPALNPHALPGLVTDVTIQGGGLNPTIAWNPNPSPTGINQTSFLLYRVREDGGITLVHAQEALDPRVTIPSTFSGTAVIDPLDTQIRIGETYMVLIINGVLDTDGRQLGRAQSYFEFTAQQDGQGGTSIYIPTVTVDDEGNKVFNFDIEVTAGEQVLIDPDIAIGYEYAVAAGDPLFASVQLPEIAGADSLYDLFLFDSDGNLFDTLIDIVAGEIFDFTTGLTEFGIGAEGLARFAIKGIEIAALLDPSDPLAFVTGLTFVSDGRFRGYQKPLTEFVEIVPVPEPGSIALLAGGIALILVRRKRRTWSDR